MMKRLAVSPSWPRRAGNKTHDVYCAGTLRNRGLIGSTEWVETHAAELAEKAVVYINTDSSGRGFLGVVGSHKLERFINEVAQGIPDPQRD